MTVMTPLIQALCAAAKSDQRGLKFLLDQGIDPNVPDEKGERALLHAIRSKGSGNVHLLLEAGANPHLISFDQATELGTVLNQHIKVQSSNLLAAATAGNLDAVNLSLQGGADSNAQNKQGKSALMWAAQGGHLSCVERLLAAGADSNAQNEYGSTVLMFATQKGHLACVERLLAAGADSNAQNEDDQTALMWAAQKGHLACVKALVAGASNVNTVNKDGNVALTFAAGNGQTEIVQILLDEGATLHLNLILERGSNALIVAAQGGHLACVEALLAASADPNAQTKDDGFTALMWAAKNGHVEIVQALLPKMSPDAINNAENKYGSIALIFAAQGGHIACVNALLAANADTNAQDTRGNTALIVAAQGGHIACVNALLAANADTNAQDTRDNTALIFAANNGHVACVEALLAASAHPDLKNEHAITALMYAAQNGDTDIVQAVVDAGADPNVQNKQGSTALMKAADQLSLHDAGQQTSLAQRAQMDRNVIRVLLTAGANFELKDTAGYTAGNFGPGFSKYLYDADILDDAGALIFADLYYCRAWLDKPRGALETYMQRLNRKCPKNVDAILGAQFDVEGQVGTLLVLAASKNTSFSPVQIAYLISQSASMKDMIFPEGHRVREAHAKNYARALGFLIMHHGSQLGTLPNKINHLANVKALLQKMTPNAINAPGTLGKTALILAARNGHVEIVQALVDAGADIDLQSKSGSTALMFAASKGHTDVVKALLGADADLNAKNNNKNTALMVAAQNGHVGCVQVLLAAKAHSDLKNEHDQTALMVAAQNGHVGIVQILLNAGAEPNVQNKQGNTALMVAAQTGHTDVVKALLAAKTKPDLEVSDKEGITALMVAANRGHTAIVRVLVAKAAHLDARDEHRDTALMVAAQNGHVGCVQVLLAAKAHPDLKKAHPDLKNEHDQTALILAVMNERPAVVSALLKGGADPSVVEHYTESKDEAAEPEAAPEAAEPKSFKALLKGESQCICRRVMQGHMKRETQALLQKKGIFDDSDQLQIQDLMKRECLQFDAVDEAKGNTLLMWAVVEAVDIKLVKALLDGRCLFEPYVGTAVIDHLNTDKETALIMAIKNGANEIVKLLLERGAKMNVGGARSALQAVVRYHRPETQELLQNYSRGQLSAAIESSDLGRVERISALIAQGCDVNARDSEGQSALMLAVEKGEPDIVGLCLLLKLM